MLLNYVIHMMTFKMTFKLGLSYNLARINASLLNRIIIFY